jgi:hypothetical protein
MKKKLNAGITGTTESNKLKTKSINSLKSKFLTISFCYSIKESREWIHLVNLFNKLQKESTLFSYEGMLRVKKTIKPMAELGTNFPALIRKNQFIILISSTKEVTMDFLMSSLKKAGQSVQENNLISHCHINILPHKYDYRNKLLFDDLDVLEVVNHVEEHRESAEDFMNVLFDFLMKKTAAIRYYFSDFFVKQNCMLEASKLMTSAAMDNYKPAVKFMNKLTHDLEKGKSKNNMYQL